MNAIGAFDARMRDLHQEAYAYIWDRFGIYVGTVRLWLVIGGWGEGILRTAWELTVARTIGPAVGLPVLGLAFGFILWRYGRRYLVRDWNQQDTGALNALNAQAIEERKGGLAARIAIGAFLLWVAVATTQGAGEALVKLLTGALVMSWSYSLEILVRERDPDRIARMRAAAEGV